ncbi:uncharacterized protein LOC116208773 [Punica granatum]|uniref:AB hydrolase-1 domain-containing protein n=2 Tax=Punica granatum TaxID=22663 RepID=A0A218XC71_PUNGR|nr:uncharacterized protein LOC116208773 [Punica granatum]OWM82524.1 hypothetical protein CDL15_Pgr002099 [Punica granatum]PKI38527.1 hypothetical protein CRG98_041092 [Punica granatum]
MAAAKVAAAAARPHTRRATESSSSILPPGIFKALLAVSLVGFLAWAYQAIQPPEPNIPGSQGGPPITAPRIKLRDGRHLAYKEHGAPRDTAKYKIIFVHGFDSCRHDAVIATGLSQSIIDELGVYIVSFDRPGYGESDPDPNRTPKSIALDIEELADQLGLGARFYLVGFSMGGQILWGCLKYIPHRLAGASLLAPVVNYWWPGLPSNLSTEAYYQQLPQDQWAVRVAHYLPWLANWWNTQKWFPGSSVVAHSPDVLSLPDKIIISKRPSRAEYEVQVRQQGEYESLYRDMTIGFGTWEFDPTALENPFPNNEGTVHVWHGDQDLLVPVTLQRFIAQRLPWIQYYELPETGHLFPHAEEMPDLIVKKLLLGETASST